MGTKYNISRYIRLFNGLRKTVFFALCITLSVSGCALPAHKNNTADKNETADSRDSGGQGMEQKPPAYVYYIKDTDLMRADVNAKIQSGTNPAVIMEDAGANASLKNYYDVMPAADGSYQVFHFEIGSEISNLNEQWVAVNSADGTAELIYEGSSYAAMCGRRLLFADLEPSASDDRIYSLYSYTPEEGKKLIISDVHDYHPSEDGQTICFRRLDEAGNAGLYLYRDGKETLLSKDMVFAGASDDFSYIYMDKPIEDGELFYYELAMAGRDGTKEEILTGSDNAGSFYLDPGTGGVYYSVYGKDGVNSLYYQSGEEKKLLSDEMSMVWEFVQKPFWLDGKSMMVYTAGSGEQKRLYAAIDGTVSEFKVPGIQDDWVGEYVRYMSGGDGAVYLSLSKLDDSNQWIQSWIYKYELAGECLGQSPECVAEGTELYVVKEESGHLFYTDFADSQDLYCGSTEILENCCSGSLLRTGQEDGEYFAFRENASSAPDLMRITTSGSSKVFREDTVQGETFAGGLLYLSDCGDRYPYRGTLSYYDGMGIKVVDEGVSVFFQHDTDQFVDAVPFGWDLIGPEYEDSDEEYDPNHDSLGRAYIEDGIFYSTDYGFTMDLSEGGSGGGHYEIDGYSQEEGMALVCYDGEDNERYSVYMMDMAHEVYEECKDLDSAQALGQWLTDIYESTMKEYGLEVKEDNFLVEKAEDIRLDGRKAYKLVIKTKAGLMTNQSTYIRYFIPDPENGRLIDFSRQFFSGLESEEDIQAYQEFVESLKWMEAEGTCPLSLPSVKIFPGRHPILLLKASVIIGIIPKPALLAGAAEGGAVLDHFPGGM